MPDLSAVFTVTMRITCMKGTHLILLIWVLLLAGKKFNPSNVEDSLCILSLWRSRRPSRENTGPTHLLWGACWGASLHDLLKPSGLHDHRATEACTWAENPCLKGASSHSHCPQSSSTSLWCWYQARQDLLSSRDHDFWLLLVRQSLLFPSQLW